MLRNLLISLLCLVSLNAYSQVRMAGGLIIINDSHLILKDNTSNAITGTSGGVLTKTANSFINIGATGGLYTYTIPFITSTADTVPLRFQVTSATTGNSISFNSFEVNNDNTPLPTTTYVGGTSSDVTLGGIDRFWKIIPYGFTNTFPQSQVTFTYSALDIVGNTIVENELQVKRFNSTISDWNDKSYGVLVNNRKVTVPLTATSDFFNVWTLYYTPNLLPIEFISFSSKCDDNGTTLEWITAEELNVSHYVVEYSKDARNWTYIQNIPAQGKQLNDYILNVTQSGYFRLTLVSIDSSKEILNITYSSCKTKEVDWIVEGNIIKFNTNIDKLTIYTALGQIISYNRNINQIQIPDTKQVFIVVAEIDGEIYSFKIAKHE